MKCLLLALGLALVCGAQAIFVPQNSKDLDIQKMWEQGFFVPQNVENLDVQKVAGTWYSMAMAASDIALLDTEGAPLRVYIKELRPTPQNNLEIVLHRREAGSCAERKILAEKTEVSAEFRITNLDQNKVHVVATDYDNYLILCMENTDVPGQGLGCQYLARTPKVDVRAMEQFNRALKLLPTHIWMLFTPTQVEERCRV